MRRPELKKGEYFLEIAELSTGIVLNPRTLERWSSDSLESHYLTVHSKIELDNVVGDILERGDKEVYVYDDSDNCEVYRSGIQHGESKEISKSDRSATLDHRNSHFIEESTEGGHNVLISDFRREGYESWGIIRKLIKLLVIVIVVLAVVLGLGVLFKTWF